MFGNMDGDMAGGGDFNALGNSTLDNETHYANGTMRGLPDDIRVVKDSYPMHQFLWRIGIIFLVSGVIIIGSFLAMLSYSRRRRLFRRRRRRMTHTLAFENQLSTTQDESDLTDSTRVADDHVTPVHSSCGRWSRDDSMPRARSRSRSRSPGHPHVSQSPRAISPPSHVTRARPSHGIEDDMLMSSDCGLSDLDKLSNARLAFKEDASKYAEYDSTRERVQMGV